MHHRVLASVLPLFSVLKYLVRVLVCVCVLMGAVFVFSPLRVVSSLRSCALGVLCVYVWGGGCWIMDGGEEGMRAGLEGTYTPPFHPQHFRLNQPRTPPPSSLFPPVSLSAQTVAIHAWRRMRVTGDGSLFFSPSLLLFFFPSRYTFILISLFPSFADFCWAKQSDTGPFSRNWSADVEKMKQRHIVSWFFHPLEFTSHIWLALKARLLADVK